MAVLCDTPAAPTTPRSLHWRAPPPSPRGDACLLGAAPARARFVRARRRRRRSHPACLPSCTPVGSPHTPVCLCHRSPGSASLRAQCPVPSFSLPLALFFIPHMPRHRALTPCPSPALCTPHARSMCMRLLLPRASLSVSATALGSGERARGACSCTCAHALPGLPEDRRVCGRARMPDRRASCGPRPPTRACPPPAVLRHPLCLPLAPCKHTPPPCTLWRWACGSQQ